MLWEENNIINKSMKCDEGKRHWICREPDIIDHCTHQGIKN
jgi:hypothetical protein